jgi:hypothetical protein
MNNKETEKHYTFSNFETGLIEIQPAQLKAIFVILNIFALFLL